MSFRLALALLVCSTLPLAGRAQAADGEARKVTAGNPPGAAQNDAPSTQASKKQVGPTRTGSTQTGASKSAAPAAQPRPKPLAPPLAKLPLPATTVLSAAEPQHPTIVPEKARRVRWNPRWRKFGWGNLIATGAGGLAAFSTLAIPPAETRWVTENEFDRSARNALRLEKLSDRNRARDASDIMLVLSINQVLVDTLIVTWWGHGNEEVAWQMALMSTEALALNAGINGLVSAISSRERPYRGQCEGLLAEELSDCRTTKRFRSFYSGHTSTAFAMAGLTCMHHAHQPLYGGGAADPIACVTSFGLAAATGLMRVAADQHWTSDVLVGAAAGTFSGLALPWLLHYRTGDMPEAPKGFTAQLVPTGTGAMVMGTF